MGDFKKWVLFALPPLILIVEIVIRHDPVSKLVASQLSTEKQTVVLWGSGILFCVFLLHHYVQVIRPFKKYERLEATRRNVLDLLSDRTISAYESREGIRVRMNVMVAERAYVSKLAAKEGDPEKTRWQIWTRHLRIFWRSKTMRHSSDANLTLSVDQGIAGEAFRKEEPVFVDMTQVSGENYGLNKKQIEKTDSLSFVYSFPIRKRDLNTDRITGDIIGVPNVDSMQDGSEVLISDDDKLEELTERIKAFSEVCSQLL